MLGFGSNKERAQSRKRLGEILVEEGRIQPEALKAALARQRKEGGLLGRLLVESNQIDESMLLAYLSKISDPAALSLADYNINVQALQQIPEALCEQYSLLPIDKLGRILTVAMVDPLDTVALQELVRTCPDLRIKPLFCSWDDFATAFKRIYKRELEKPADLDGRHNDLDVEMLTTSPVIPPGLHPQVQRRLEEEDRLVTAAELEDDFAPETALLEPSDLEAAAKPTEPSVMTYAGPAPVAVVPATDFSAGIQELAVSVRDSIQEVIREFATTTLDARGDSGSAEEMRSVASAMQQALEGAVSALAENLRQEHETLRDQLREDRNAREQVLSRELSQERDVLRSELQETRSTTETSLAEALRQERDALRDQLREEREAREQALTRILGQERDVFRAELHEARSATETSLAEALRQERDALREQLREDREAREQALTRELSQERDVLRSELHEARSATETSLVEALRQERDALRDQLREEREARELALTRTLGQERDVFRAELHEARSATETSLAEALRQERDALREQLREDREAREQAFARESGQDRDLLRNELLAALQSRDATPSPADLAEALGNRLNTVLHQGLQAMSEQMQQVGAAIQELGPGPSQGPSPSELVEALQSAVQQATRQSAATMTESLHHVLAQQASAPDPVQMAEMMRDGISAAMGNALDAMSGQILSLVEAQQQQIAALPPPPDIQSATRALREQMAVDVDARLTLLSEHLRNLLDRSQTAQGGHIETLAQAVRESVLTAVNASEKNLADVQGRLAATVEASLAAVAGQKGEQQGDLARIAEAILNAIEHDKATQSGKQDQLAQIAQAALDSVRQTTHLIEAHTVAETNRNDLMRRRKAQHASVTPFNPEGVIQTEAHAEGDKRVRDGLDSEQPVASMTFDNFFSGETNAFTVKLARAVAGEPGGEYNPLFVYGAVGLGKTHLISAIGNEILASAAKNRPPLRVGYLSASHFSRRLAAATADNSLELFRDNYCHWDVLILDDIQFLGGRVEAQEEFFHIFNVLLNAKRQIVIAGDKPPDNLGLLEQRLVSRFASGIVAELKAPDWETRMQILRNLVKHGKMKVSEDILSLISLRVANDTRKMTGALRKIIAYTRIQGNQISMEEAQAILSHLDTHEAA